MATILHQKDEENSMWSTPLRGQTLPLHTQTKMRSGSSTNDRNLCTCIQALSLPSILRQHIGLCLPPPTLTASLFNINNNAGSTSHRLGHQDTLIVLCDTRSVSKMSIHNQRKQMSLHRCHPSTEIPLLAVHVASFLLLPTSLNHYA